MLAAAESKKILCLAVDDEPPALEVINKFIGSVRALQLAGSFNDAVEAMNFLQQEKVDLLFLDIKMPELLGTDFIRALKNPPKVIFTTAYRKYAVEGFELDAVDYLLKPISFERFLKAVNKVMDTSLIQNEASNALPSAQSSNAFIVFRIDRKAIKVALDEILFIESLKDYIKIVTVSRTLITKQSISSLEEKLPASKFIRVHRSFIISLDKIESYTNDLINIGNHDIPISRLHRLAVEKVLANNFS